MFSRLKCRLGAGQNISKCYWGQSFILKMNVSVAKVPPKVIVLIPNIFVTRVRLHLATQISIEFQTFWKQKESTLCSVFGALNSCGSY